MILFHRIFRWAIKKWEAAEEWRPKAIALALVATITLIYLMSRNNNRGPASFEEVADSDVPAETIYSSTKLSQSSPRSDSLKMSRTPLVSIRDSTLTKSAIEKRLGMSTLRARAVVFDPHWKAGLKKRQPGQEYIVPLELFPGVEKVIHLKVVSGFEVNSGLHSGVVEGDESSKVQLSIEENSIAISIDSKNGRFRVIHDPITGYDYVIEVER